MKISDLVGKKDVGVRVRIPASLMKKSKGTLVGNMNGTFTGRLKKEGRVVRLAVRLSDGKIHQFRPQDVTLT